MLEVQKGHLGIFLRTSYLNSSILEDMSLFLLYLLQDIASSSWNLLIQRKSVLVVEQYSHHILLPSISPRKFAFSVFLWKSGERVIETGSCWLPQTHTVNSFRSN